jgi:hypothetical protein
MLQPTQVLKKETNKKKYFIGTTIAQHPLTWGWVPHTRFDSWKMLDLQHQYNKCTTIPHQRVVMWGPPSSEGLLYSCCIGVVNLTFSSTHWAPPHVKGCCVIVVVVFLNPSFSKKKNKNVRFTTPIQQPYNNPSHEGGSHILGSTLI